MSFTTEIKQEISMNELKQCCQRAQLSALVQLCSTLKISSNGIGIMIKTENATIAKRIWKMLKSEFNIDIELSVMKKMNLKKNNIYIITVINDAKMVLDTLGILTDKGLNNHPAYSLVSKECCARAYLAGAFMAAGSINSPTKSNYHLEITTNDIEHAKFIQKLMQRFDLPAKIITRRKQEVVYCKAADKIADFLRCIGAYDALMHFEDIRITRDFRNNLTRLDNCEIANEQKSVAAAERQIEDIELLKEVKMLDTLDEKLVTVAYLRLEHPDASLNELADEYYLKHGISLSKSGIKHRIKKINDIASKIRTK